MAIEVAKKYPLIEQRSIFVLGHSLGGYAMPRIAARSAVPCGFIVMAGTVHPLEQIFVRQMQRFARVDGDVSAEEAAAIAEAEVAERRVGQLRPGVRMDRKLLPGRLPVSYWLDLKANPATEYARRLTRPVLVLQGSRDINVGIEELSGWRHYLSHNPSASYKSYPTLNHLFMASDGKTGTDEYLEPGNVAQEVIEDIAAWTRQRATHCAEAQVPAPGAAQG
jgi:pimeloyl-ACP methyl ester carboxylesterase